MIAAPRNEIFPRAGHAEHYPIVIVHTLLEFKLFTPDLDHDVR